MTNKQIRTDLEQQIRALPSIKDENGDECVSREVVLAMLGAQSVPRTAGVADLPDRPIHRMYKGGYTGKAGGGQ